MKKKLKFVFLTFSILTVITVVCTYLFTDNYATITLKRSIEINDTKQKVFNYITHTQNKAQWLSDPNKKIARNSKGEDATVGFVRSWEIQSPPEKGSETITKIEFGRSVETQIKNNVNGEQTNSKHKLSCTSVDSNKTILTWEIESNLHLKFLPRMLLGFSRMFMKPDDYQNAYEESFQNEMEKNGTYKSMDENLQKLKVNIEE